MIVNKKTVSQIQISKDALTLNTTNNRGSITIPNMGSFTILSFINNTVTAKGSDKNADLTVIFHLINPMNLKNFDNTLYPWFISSTVNAVVSIYFKNTLLIKFSSYRICLNNNNQEDCLSKPIDPVIYTVVKAGDIFREYPPLTYDLTAYNIITSDLYTYADQLITVSNSSPLTTSNQVYHDSLKFYYGGTVSFAIKRVYLSPTGNDILTRLSDRIDVQLIDLNGIPNTSIATSITIKSFDQDYLKNPAMTSKFTPRGIFIFFYKYLKNNSNTKYHYTNDYINGQDGSIFTKNAFNLYDKDNNSNSVANNFFSNTDSEYPISDGQSQNISYSNIDQVSIINNNGYQIQVLTKTMIPVDKKNLSGSTFNYDLTPFFSFLKPAPSSS
jgi:hypothetical protein